jgi:hypothetical protein
MWGSKDNERFSREIIDSILSRSGINTDAAKFFGSNDIYNKQYGNYIEDSAFYKQMTELIGKDNSFSQFLQDYDVDVKKPLPLNNKQKDILFRKIKPIVYYRNFYIESYTSIRGTTTFRSRKSGDLLYYGIEVLCRICDGNPRWLIGIINSILSKSSKNSAEKKVQYQELLSASKRFKNAIENIPIGQYSSYTLSDIVEKIGTYFTEQLLGYSFNMDPKGTFVIDESEKEIPNYIIDLLEKGISQGAFILVDSDDSALNFKIRGQRFKLAYLFSILYKLPLRRYPDIKLSECLKGIELNSVNQISLF